MATLKKKALSHFLRTHCERRLRLDLYPDSKRDPERSERINQGNMPPANAGRPALAGLRKEGKEWEEQVYNDLITVFENKVLYSKNLKGTFEGIDLATNLVQLTTTKFIIEPSFTVTKTFRERYGLDRISNQLTEERSETLKFAKDFRPDIIEVLEPSAEAPTENNAMDGDGKLYSAPSDSTGLRVIDVKLSASPSVPYFGEVAFYSMILADWLKDKGLSGAFHVSSDPAVWPGQYAGSALAKEYSKARKIGATLSPEAAKIALNSDLSILPRDVYTARVREFLETELPTVLVAPNWQSLKWHVNQQCVGCEYLGFKWTLNTPVDDEHCWPKATREQKLSQVIGITQGASSALVQNNVPNISALRKVKPEDGIFDSHYTLSTSRAVLSSRAKALGSGLASKSPRSSNSLLPKNVDVVVLIGVEFDISSGISFAFSWQAFEINATTRQRDNKEEGYYVVNDKNIDEESNVLCHWLNKISDYLNRAAQNRGQKATFQVYMWDGTSYNHLKRVVTRHLHDILAQRGSIRAIAWLFPSDESLPEYRYANSSRPLSLVKTQILSSISADTPFYYNLTSLAKQYYPTSFAAPPTVNISSFYNDPLSDHIPSERAHDIWGKSKGDKNHYIEVKEDVERACKTKLNCLGFVLMRAEEDFPKASRPEAPPLSILHQTRALPGVCQDGELWYSFQRLNSALQSFDAERTLSLDPYEQEARFLSIRLDSEVDRRLLGKLKKKYKLKGRRIRAFKVCHRSLNSKIKLNKIGYSLLPENILDKANFKSVYFIHNSTTLRQNQKRDLFDKYDQGPQTTLRDIFSVEVRAFDRTNSLILVELNKYHKELQNLLENEGVVDFHQLSNRSRAIIQPIHIDLATSKIKNSLKAIKNPPLAQSNPLISVHSNNKLRKNRVQPSPSHACNCFIWDAKNLDTTSSLEPVVKKFLQGFDNKGVNIKLNKSQNDALVQIMTKRLSLIWGPPGTGKTSTLAKSIDALCNFSNAGYRKPMRVLVSAYTWAAIDTLCGKLLLEWESMSPPASIFRLGTAPPNIPINLFSSIKLCDANKKDSKEFINLKMALEDKTENTIVFATPHQVFNLRKNAKEGDRAATSEMFDHIIIDEASQLDMQSMMMIYPSFASESSLTVVGDDKQMPPIFAAELPVGFENLFGSVFTFYADYWGIDKKMLEVNYRSNQKIVDFTKSAGYNNTFTASKANANTKVTYDKAINKLQPWIQFVLDPDKSLICIVHDDDSSPQLNQLETLLTADLLTAIVDSDLEGYTFNELFSKGVGVVTPHTAQRAAVFSEMQKRLQNSPDYDDNLLNESIDTVERFQGQERDVVIISYALSDRDSISQEEEFIFGLERFNVAVSRAKHKVVVIVSKELVKHIPQELEVVEASRLLKQYAAHHLTNSNSFSYKANNNNSVLDIRYS